MNNLEVKGDRDVVKNKLRQRWVTLTDDDLQYCAGNQEALLGRIQKCCWRQTDNVPAKRGKPS